MCVSDHLSVCPSIPVRIYVLIYVYNSLASKLFCCNLYDFHFDLTFVQTIIECYSIDFF